LLRHHCLGYGFLQKRFDSRKLVLLSLTHKCVSSSFAGCTGGSADAVYIVFAVVGHIIIDDQVDVFDIDSATEDIGRHQNLEFLIPEIEQHLLALALIQI